MSQFEIRRACGDSRTSDTEDMPKRPRDPNQLAKLILDIAITPAMASGISDHVWSYEEIAELAE